MHSSILPGVLCQTYEQSVTKQRSSRIKMAEENALDVSTGVEEEASAKPARAALLSTARLKKLNERLGLFLNLGAKLVAIVGVTMLVALILGQIFRSENFSIARLDVPGELVSKGYTGELIARHIADDMRSLVAAVPDKLVSMFVVAGMNEEDKEKLESSIVEEYEDRKDEVNISLSFAMFDLPVDLLLVHIRGWLGIDNTTVESAITIEDSTISMSVGLVRNGETSAFEVFREHYENDQSNSMYQALDRLVQRTAEFILKTNHPIVMVLQDYHYVPGKEYSERDDLWNDNVYTANERIRILVDRSEDPPDESRARRRTIKKWAHAILGVVLDDHQNRKEAIDQYREAIRVDPQFVTTVGPRLVYPLPHDPSWEDYGSAIEVLDDMLAVDASSKPTFDAKLLFLRAQRKRVSEQPDRNAAKETIVDGYQKLLRQVRGGASAQKLRVQKDLVETLAEFDGNSDEFYTALESAIREGLSLSDDDMAFSPWKEYANDSHFQELRKASSGRASAETDSLQLLRTVIENNPGAFSEKTKQIVLVTSEKAGDVLAKIHTFEKRNGGWVAELGVMNASGGRKGFAYFDEKSEGDGHAPSGVFALERTFGYEESVRTRMDYEQVSDRDWWIDDRKSPNYNQWVKLKEGDTKFKDANEALKRSDRLYHYAIVVEYNTKKPVSGKGSAIFIHWERSPGAPTAGCIATSLEGMEALFLWLDPEKKPLIVMGNKAELPKLSGVAVASN